MHVLVTGGAGFIGSHLCEELLSAGHSVHVLDDLSTGSIENIRHLRDSGRFGYTIDTCRDPRLVSELVDDADYIYHLAAAVGVQLIVDSPVRTIENNVHGTEVVLAQAATKRKPVFLASTSEVYGKSTALPFREDGDIVMGATSRGRWAYACSKAIDEFLALAYYAERKLPTVVARLFNTVGPRQTARYGMVVPNFVSQALAGRPITVFGTGEQRRCFCHVRDVVRCLAAILDRDDLYGEVFNIGSSEEISVLGLAERIKSAAQSESDIIHISYEDAYGAGFEDMQRRIPDTSKVEAALGWRAEATLDDIVREMIEYEMGVQERTAPPA